ncbi:hypothetical protein [Thalassobacillus sp. C254]|uniref:hypothetical protein n=1 Tax=Thalassobacillus sp. C254 TaxID=1225341 RepID=UPI0009F8A4DD|nr:hypothetical protein [Thalassobacillus sp. C254]
MASRALPRNRRKNESYRDQPDQKQVWLEKDQEGNPAVIRVFRADIDWSKWLKEDIEKAKKSFQKAKRFVAAKKAPFYNVYVSPYPPIDNWNDAAKNRLITRGCLCQLMSLLLQTRRKRVTEWRIC